MGVTAILGCASAPAAAIPSPDLLINLTASAAQTLGLLSVVVGGFAYSAKKKPRSHTERRRAWRWVFHALVISFLVSVAVNLFQYTTQLDERQHRLQTNLIRPSVENGQAVGDVSLKTLSFSQQMEHPLGISTGELAQRLNQNKPMNLVDVRETEEVEMGRVPGSRHMRYPDLRAQTYSQYSGNGELVLMCYSGNRSSELCSGFAEDGKQCNFVIGGYEKWIAEDLPLELSDKRSADELRELPDFPHRLTLLDTPEVTTLLEEEAAIFVDVRYPDDFALGHLPDAVNIPVRKLPTAALDQQLRSLPNQPVIAPCYDKRSCFYAQILGLKLHRLGYDYRGRYTVPQEFFVPRTEKMHVTQWRKERAGRTPLGFLERSLESLLSGLSQWTGQLAAGILTLVVILRLFFSPVAWKAERDQWVQRRLEPQAQALKERFRGNKLHASQAVMALYRRHGVTPLRNLFGTAIQVMLFLIFFGVVKRISDSSEEHFLWVPGLGQPDPTHILPVLVGALLTAYLIFIANRRSRWFLGLYVACGTGIAWLMLELNTGVNLYLLFSLVFIFAQTDLIWRQLQKRYPVMGSEAVQPTQTIGSGIVPLAQAHRFFGVGNKAARLGEMLQAGLPVPGGFAVTTGLMSRALCSETGTSLDLGRKETAQIERMWRRFGVDSKVAVRSSGLNEDGENQSYAGVFESRLNVGQQDFMRSLAEVGQSLASGRAAAYSGNSRETGGIVVQKMVDAQYAGVLFSEHPVSTGCMLIELTQGLGESLVNGSVTPEAYRFGRVSGRCLEHRPPPIDLAPLLEMGRRVEALFGQPQDVEWAYAEGQFYLLQARNITAPVRDREDRLGLLEQERARLISVAGQDEQIDEPLLVQDSLAEILPRPTPLSMSVMERLWEADGSTELACQELGVPYRINAFSKPYVVSAFGALYVNQPEGRRRSGKGPGTVAAFKLARSAEQIKRDFKKRFLKGFLRKIRRHEVMDLTKLRTKELIVLFDRWLNDFVVNTYLQAEIINVAADFYWKTAQKELEQLDEDPALHLGVTGETIVCRAMALLPEIRAGKRDRLEFLELFGHRAPNDYELAQPRYAEDEAQVDALIERAEYAESVDADETPERLLPSSPVLALSVERARRFQALKEEAKHQCLRQLCVIRRVLLEIGGQTGLDDGIFQLRWDEVLQLKRGAFVKQARSIVARRQQQRAAWASVRLPSVLTLKDLESINLDGSGDPAMRPGQALWGIKVSGKGEVIGPVQIIDDARDIGNFTAGNILVARFTDPTWTPLFRQARGLVTEVGGWLSHSAIVAREYGLTAVVGVTGALSCLQTGQLVRLNEDGTVEAMSTRRIHQRAEVSVAVELSHQSGDTTGTLRDLSQSGAHIETEAQFSIGDQINLDIPGNEAAILLKVVHATTAGYGLQFPDVLGERLMHALCGDCPA